MTRGLSKFRAPDTNAPVPCPLGDNVLPMSAEQNPLQPTAARWVTCSTEDLKASTDRALEDCRAGIRDLRQLTRPTASEVALARYDDAVAVLSDASARASVVRNAHPDSAMRDLAESCEQELEKLGT